MRISTDCFLEYQLYWPLAGIIRPVGATHDASIKTGLSFVMQAELPHIYEGMTVLPQKIAFSQVVALHVLRIAHSGTSQSSALAILSNTLAWQQSCSYGSGAGHQHARFFPLSSARAAATNLAFAARIRGRGSMHAGDLRRACRE
jgi:hypothetical protein